MTGQCWIYKTSYYQKWWWLLCSFIKRGHRVASHIKNNYVEMRCWEAFTSLSLSGLSFTPFRPRRFRCWFRTSAYSGRCQSGINNLTHLGQKLRAELVETKDPLKPLTTAIFRIQIYCSMFWFIYRGTNQKNWTPNRSSSVPRTCNVWMPIKPCKARSNSRCCLPELFLEMMGNWRCTQRLNSGFHARGGQTRQTSS